MGDEGSTYQDIPRKKSRVSCVVIRVMRLSKLRFA